MKPHILLTLFNAFLLLYTSPAYTQATWADYADSVKKFTATQKADTNKVNNLILISDYYQMISPDSGFAYAQQALALAEKLQFDKGIFWSIVATNKSLYVLGNYSLELDYAFKALPIGKKLNTPYAQGWINGMLGDCYYNLGDYTASIGYYREVQKICEQNSIIDLFSIYSLLAPVFVSLHQNDSALIYAKKGYELFKHNPALNKNDDEGKWFKCLVFRSLGEAFAGNSAYDSSLFYYHLSLPLSEDFQSAIIRTDVCNGIAKVYKEVSNLDSATWYAKKVLTEKTAKNYPAGLLKAANILADIYELQNKPDSTLKYLRIALATKDSLFSREKTAAVQNIFFKEQEKQKAIATATEKLQSQYRMYFMVALFLVSLIIAGIIIRNRRIKQLQQMRNSIADDLHDDIGSTLSSIHIMSELAKVKSPEALPLLASIGESSATIQENMSDIVWAIKPENDRFENVLQRMNQFASEILDAKNIELQFNSDHSLSTSRLTMDQRKNFYLFFKETINNAAKYADAKKVCVQILQKNHIIEMNIQDNGKGFDTNKVFTGNGMNTLKKRAAELRGDFKITSHLQEGTAVQLSFKIT